MRIIHCADLHLDSKMNANLDKEKAKERKSELLLTFQNMVHYAVDNEVTAILIAGDLFDTKAISATARKKVYDEMIQHPQIGFYYLNGNHDADAFTAQLEKKPDNLYLFTEAWTTYTLGTQDMVQVTGTELVPGNAGIIYDSLVLNVEKINIVMLHGQESTYASKDKAEVIHLNALRNKGIDYLALGHIHAYKEAKLDSRGKYCYSGCLEGRGFDECGEHGFVLLEIDEQRKIIENTFIPFACRNLYTVEVPITGVMSTTEAAERVENMLKEQKADSRSLVKIVLTGNVDVACELNENLLLKQFQDRFYFLKIYNEVKMTVDYHDYAYDESLKGEYVRTVLQSDELSEEEKAIIIRYGIQALDGEELG